VWVCVVAYVKVRVSTSGESEDGPGMSGSGLPVCKLGRGLDALGLPMIREVAAARCNVAGGEI